MQKSSTDKDWEAFSDWERTYKRKALKALTVNAAFALFSELWEAQTKLRANEIEKFRERKIEELIMLRKSFNLIQKRLHA